MCQSGCNNENYWGDCNLGYCEVQMMEERKKMSFLKGDIYYADLNNAIGDVQQGIRPVVVVSNNFYNNFSNCVTVVPISSSMGKVIRTHVVVEGEEYLRDCGLRKVSKVMCENIMAISKKQLKDRVGHLPTELKKEVNKAIQIQLAI